MADEKGAEGTPVEQGDPKQTQKEEPLTLEAVKKMIQSETDRVRTEYSRKLKDVETEKEELQKERMSEKERAQFEIEQERRKNKEAAEEVATQRLELDRTQVILDLAIPKPLARFIQGKSKDEMIGNAEALTKYIDAEVLRGINAKLATSAEKVQSGEKKETSGTDLAAWQKVWAMPPGPEKDSAMRRMFESLKGQDIETYTG